MTEIHFPIFRLRISAASASYLRVSWLQDHQHLCTTVLSLPHMEPLALLKYTHQLLNQALLILISPLSSMNRSSKGRWDVYIHFEQSTMCFGLESSPRLQYTLSKVNYSPTTWGLVSHLSTYKSPRMPHVSPGWGFPVTSALRLFH